MTVKTDEELEEWVESNYDQIEGLSDQEKVRIGYHLALEDQENGSSHLPSE